MIEINKNPFFLDRNSSKGNQSKWKVNNKWYKGDYCGYEGLSEFVVSQLLKKSTLNQKLLVSYDLEKIKYNDLILTGCCSDNFLEENKSIFTLERLYKQVKGESLYSLLYRLDNVEDRIRFLVNEIEMMTGLDLGVYLNILITIDAFFLNEDRHLHNIAVICDDNNHFELCPVFDNGACLLSDLKLDYPLSENPYKLIKKVKPKTFGQYSFDEQLEATENIYGYKNIRFQFNKKDIDDLLVRASDYYSKEIIERVRTILYTQTDKYGYLFSDVD